MTDTIASGRKASWRLLGWGALAVLLSIPAIFRWPWTGSDFVIMGILLGSVGLGIELLVRLSGNALVRLGAIVVVLTSFLTIWVNLAVGMIGDENLYNLLFLIPVATGVLGVISAKLDASRSAMVAIGAAVLQLAIGFGGYAQDPRGAMLSACFALFWLFAAALFRAGVTR